MQASRNNLYPIRLAALPPKTSLIKIYQIPAVVLKDVSSLPCVRLIKYSRHVNKQKNFLITTNL